MATAHARPAVGRFAPWLLAFVFAALLAPFLLAEKYTSTRADFETGSTAAVTLRVPALTPAPLGGDGGAIAIARGETVDERAAAYAEQRSATGRWGLIAVSFLAVLIWSLLLRRDHRGRLLRVQLVTLGLVVVLVASLCVALLLTPVSLFALPIPLVGFLVARRSSTSVAVASAALSVVIVASLAPVDLGSLAVLSVQALLPAYLIPRHARLWQTALVALLAACAGAVAFGLAHYAALGSLPTLDSATHSTWLSAALGAPFAALLAQPLRPLYSWLCGDVSSPTLSRLERLSQPLLKQIADKAPGTWQHSLAMANLAEAAGRRVGADLQLLRVGAYYHDLGKSLQPKFFIENVSSGQASLHDNLSAQASRDGIFSHVTSGIAAAREAGLPERVIDFIRSHHGGGLLEYFWAKQNQEDAEAESSASFCYPGSRPQCPETGIMCICDAVEGATRTLKTPANGEIENIVDHILFGKVRTGQLEECGLSLRELLTIRDALCEALLTAHTPAARKDQGADAISTANARPAALAERVRSPSLQGLHAVRLDSLDRPSNVWTAQSPRAAADDNPLDADMALARTETLVSDSPAPSAALAELSEAETLSILSDPGTEPPDPTPEVPPLASDSPASLTPFPEVEPAAPSSGVGAELSSTRSIGRPETAAPSEPEKVARELEAVEHDASDSMEVLLLRRPRSAPKRSGSIFDTPPPPPQKRFTIPLGEGEPSVQPAVHSRRADSEDGLRPGEMVVGAPPATHPERGNDRRANSSDEETVLRTIPLPSEARRPEDRITEEQLALVPPEAYGEDTIPRTSRPRTGAESDPNDPESDF